MDHLTNALNFIAQAMTEIRLANGELSPRTEVATNDLKNLLEYSNQLNGVGNSLKTFQMATANRLTPAK